MSEQRQSTDGDAAAPRQRLELTTAFAVQPASFWFASLAALGLIIGGIGPWAKAYGLVSVSGTSMHGWFAVGAGLVGLAMLGLHHLLGARLPLIAAGVAGVLGAMEAVTTLGKINKNGAVSLLGHQYRYVDPAWGLYLVLVGGLALLGFASALMWRTFRTPRPA